MIRNARCSHPGPPAVVAQAAMLAGTGGIGRKPSGASVDGDKATAAMDAEDLVQVCAAWGFDVPIAVFASLLSDN